MASHPSDLHFVLFPLMTQGHMIPIVDIARLLAQRGCTVTIITTPVNANRFKPVIARAKDDDKLKIQLLELTLPSSKVGLPEGCENFDMIPSALLFIKLFEAAGMLKEPAEKMLNGLNPAPSCIISDNLLPWTGELARKLNIPRLTFHGPGCFTYLCIHIALNTNVLDEIVVVSDSEYFVFPGIPDHIELTKVQAMCWGTRDTKETGGFFETVRKAEEDADGIVVNSFKELEPYYVEEFAKVKSKNVWCIGPVSLCNKSFSDKADRGSKASIDQQDCIKWLDSREEPSSVIFVCLGSLARTSTVQNIEVGLGLESSKASFIWCIRQTTEELEKWFLEEGYEERVKDRGLIVRGWAPQVLILSHHAVSGFITHCGWNSTLEGVTAGVPMVTWPHFADQFINERFIVDILKIGVKIGVEAPVLVGEQDKLGTIVTKENVEIAVECIMSKEEEGEARRKRATELAEMAKRAMEEGGSSHLGLTSMIQDTIGLLCKDSATVQDNIVQEL
uniref:UDP-glycosyltransferase 73E1-like n=1 Tax=Erigeron canadensis TaxID=72917 RepID=UPI001CB8F7C1|nr:UDP-glycosyltransferase 73E1-like [Erigeron canadensis]